MGVAVTLVTLLATLVLLMWPARAMENPLEGARWQRRLLVVVADEGHPLLLEQRRIVASNRQGFAERDLYLVDVANAGPHAAALRGRFGVGAGGFRAVLVGKDGTAKLTSDQPIDAPKLFSTIDAMPMRQEEMRGR